MNIDQLRYLLEISKCSSISEAAGKLYISQPALSKSIRELEEELRFNLLERSNKGVALTEEGREFLIYVKRIIAQYEVLEDRFFVRAGGRERFSISTQHFNFATAAFTGVINRFNPGRFSFSIYETRTREVLENVRTMRSEVGIVAYTKEREGVFRKLFREYGLQFVPLMQRKTYAYVWKNHPLAGRESVSLKELREYPYISFDQEDGGKFYLNEEAMANHLPDKHVKSTDRATSMELIASLQGYAIGSGTLSEEDAVLQGLISIKLQEEDPLIIGYIVRKGSELSEYGKAYLEELAAYSEIMQQNRETNE